MSTTISYRFLVLASFVATGRLQVRDTGCATLVDVPATDIVGCALAYIACHVDREIEKVRGALRRIARDVAQVDAEVGRHYFSATSLSTGAVDDAKASLASLKTLEEHFASMFEQVIPLDPGSALRVLERQLGQTVSYDELCYDATALKTATGILGLAFAMREEEQRLAEEKRLADAKRAADEVAAREAAKLEEKRRKAEERKAARASRKAEVAS